METELFKKLSKISIQSKIYFAKQYYDIRYSYSDMSQMITIRNKSSHRGEYSEREKEIIDEAKKILLQKNQAISYVMIHFGIR